MGKSTLRGVRGTPKGRLVFVSKLQPGRRVEFSLYHEAAVPLLQQGEVITEGRLQALRAAGIKELFECRSEDELQALAASTRKKSLPLESVPVGVPVPHNIYDPAGRFLLRRGRFLARAQYERMAAAGITHVFIDEEKRLREINRYDLELAKLRAENIEKALLRETELRVKNGACRLGELFRKQPRAPRPPQQVEKLVSRRNDCAGQAKELLNSLRKGRTVGAEAVERTVEILKEELQDDISLLLSLTGVKDTVSGEFESHSVNVAVLAMGVGFSLGYEEEHLRELGVAALLHEVGMMRLPKNLLEKQTKLTGEERQQINNHPFFALEYLRRASGLKERTALVVYQEHEAPNRKGYPNQRPAVLIHDFAKIIAICDAYEAITAPRPYRASAPPYRAMEQLVRAASKLHYDPSVMRAFLKLVGLFPVGSGVRLSSGECAKVIGGNSERYDRPLVNVLKDQTGKPLPKTKILDLSTEPNLKVAGVLDEDFVSECTAGF